MRILRAMIAMSCVAGVGCAGSCSAKSGRSASQDDDRTVSTYEVSGNPEVKFAARVIDVARLHTPGEFTANEVAVQPGDTEKGCCPQDVWKRMLPASWDAKKKRGHFVQINRLFVCRVEDGGEACMNADDTHVIVVAADAPIRGQRFIVEFDRCWRANSMAPKRVPVKWQVIDVQGFVTWDNKPGTAPTAGVEPVVETRPACDVEGAQSNWEIHPLAAWRVSGGSWVEIPPKK
jgi:hypothetical protein